MAVPRYTGEGPLEQSWLPCCCRGPGEKRRGAATSAASRKYLLCGFPGANARRIGVGADLPWKPEVVLLAPRRLLGLARLPSLEWHPPCDLSECFSCRRPPLAPLLRRGAVWRTLLKQGKAEKGEGKHEKVPPEINFGIPCHSFSSVLIGLPGEEARGAVQSRSSVGTSGPWTPSVHAAALSLPPHGCGRR